MGSFTVQVGETLLSITPVSLYENYPGETNAVLVENVSDQRERFLVILDQEVLARVVAQDGEEEVAA